MNKEIIEFIKENLTIELDSDSGVGEAYAHINVTLKLKGEYISSDSTNIWL